MWKNRHLDQYNWQKQQGSNFASLCDDAFDPRLIGDWDQIQDDINESSR